MSRIRYFAYVFALGLGTSAAAAGIDGATLELGRAAQIRPLTEPVRKQVEDRRESHSPQYWRARMRCRSNPSRCTISGYGDPPSGRSRVRDHREGHGVTPPPLARPAANTPPRRPVKFPDSSIRDRRTQQPPGRRDRRSH